MDGAEKTGRRQREAWVGCALTVVLFPAVYVGSAIIIGGLFRRTGMTPPSWLEGFLEVFYAPLIYMIEKWEWVGDTFFKILDLLFGHSFPWR